MTRRTAVILLSVISVIFMIVRLSLHRRSAQVPGRAQPAISAAPDQSGLREAFANVLAHLSLKSEAPSFRAQYQTNKQGGIIITTTAHSASYRAVFITGPISPRGEHLNPSLPAGPLLTLFETVTSSNPHHAALPSHGTTLTDEAATEQVMLIMHALGLTNQVTGHRYHVSGPFCQVELRAADDDQYSSFMNLEFRHGTVTRLRLWPPVPMKGL